MTYEINRTELRNDGHLTVWLYDSQNYEEYEVTVNYEECAACVERWWHLGDEMAVRPARGYVSALEAYALTDAKVRAAYLRDLQDARRERELSDAWGE